MVGTTRSRPDVIDGDRIEAGERLIEHEQAGPEDQCGGELDALLVAEAQRLQLIGGVQPIRPSPGHLAGDPPDRPSAGASPERELFRAEVVDGCQQELLMLWPTLIRPSIGTS